MIALEMLVVAAALSTIQRDLGASIEHLEWTVNAYVLAFAAFMVASSTLGDRFGRRRIFVAGIDLFVIGAPSASPQ